MINIFFQIFRIKVPLNCLFVNLGIIKILYFSKLSNRYSKAILNVVKNDII